jgi:hypothetical protein
MRDTRTTSGRRPKPPPFRLPGLMPVKAPPKRVLGIIPTLPNRPKVKAKGPSGPHVAANKRAPIKAPLRAAASRGKSTAATIPAHAAVPARAPARAVGAMPPRGTAARRVPPPARKPVAASTVLPPATPEMTDQDILQQLLAPQYLEVDQAEARATRAEQQRAALIQSLTGEMMSKLSGIAPQVAADYQHAGDTNLALAREGRDALSAASTNPATQADLAAINAPPEQRQQLADQAQNVFQGGGAVLFGQQGLIPGQELAARGAAQTAYSRNLPGIAGLQGMQALRSLFAAGQETNQGFLDTRAQIASKGPSLLMDLQNQRASQAAKEQALDMERFALGLKTQNQQFTQQATKARIGLQAQGVKLAGKRLELSSLQADRQWQATLRGLGIREANLKLSAAKTQHQLNNGGFTSAQVSGFQKRAGQIASDAWNGVPVREGGEVVGYNHLTYQRAMSEMLAQGIPLTVAQRALNTYWSKAGLVAPFERDENGGRLGGAGRPMISYQQRQQVAKKPKKKRK